MLSESSKNRDNCANLTKSSINVCYVKYKMKNLWLLKIYFHAFSTLQNKIDLKQSGAGKR